MPSAFLALIVIITVTRMNAAWRGGGIARGVCASGRVPAVWSFPRRMIDSRGSCLDLSSSSNSRSQTSTRRLSGMVIVRRIVRVHQALEPGNAGHRLARLRIEMRELAIAADRNAGALGSIPEIPCGGAERFPEGFALRPAPFAQIDASPTPVVRGPDLLDDVSGVCAGRECMTVVTDFRVDIEVVENAELTREGMRIGVTSAPTGSASDRHCPSADRPAPGRRCAS